MVQTNLTDPPPTPDAPTGYTAQEVRCLLALFRLAAQPRSLRRWLVRRWWLFCSSRRVVRHLWVCTYRQYHITRRRQERTARLGAGSRRRVIAAHASDISLGRFDIAAVRR